MDVLLELAILFSDKIAEVFSAFKNYSRQVAQTSEADSATKQWIFDKLQNADVKMNLQNVHCLLVNMTKTENRLIRLNAVGIDSRGKRRGKLRLYSEVVDIPDVLADADKKVALKITLSNL